MKNGPTRQPSPFVIEIDGARVVAFIADSTSEARELTREAWFRLELRERKSGGKPLWDGKSQLAWRLAMAEEIDDIASGIAAQPTSDGKIILFYLVPIDSKPEARTVDRGEFPPRRS